MKLLSVTPVNAPAPAAPSAAQKARQRMRERGKYAAMNSCERCGKSAGYDYYSEPRLCPDGRGICICKRCCFLTEKMTDAELEADLVNWAE